MAFFRKIPSRGPNTSLAALVWRSTVVCLPTVAGELLHPTTCVVRLQATVLPGHYPVYHLGSDD